MSILRVKPGCITVSFAHLLWMKPDHFQKEIISYWHSQGFAEAESMPYIARHGYLEVTRDLPTHGFFKGTGTLCEEIYNLPF